MRGVRRKPLPSPSDSAAGGVYLCQVDSDISCAACCGLYNVADAGREALEALLLKRTERFPGVSRTPEGILDFKRSVEAEESALRPFPEFHHCPFIGLIGPDRTRVGCLLHPLCDGNDGVDYRGLSYYGGMACRIYFCPSCRKLPDVYKEIVRRAADHWHTYGLVITEWELLQGFFGEIEIALGRPLQARDILESKSCRESISRFFELRVEWPFRSSLYPAPANYFFEDRKYRKPSIDYERMNMPPSRFDKLLSALVSEFQSGGALREAENLLATAVSQVTTRIRPACS
jgi:hypothetical protein